MRYIVVHKYAGKFTGRNMTFMLLCAYYFNSGQRITPRFCHALKVHTAKP